MKSILSAWREKLRAMPSSRLCAISFFLNFLTIFAAGYVTYAGSSVATALEFAVPLTIILVCHESGHFFFGRRAMIRTDYPLFVPLPLPPIGTMGAIMRFSGAIPNRRALFDMAVAGPIGGLIPSLIALAVGLSLSKFSAQGPENGGALLDAPLILQGIATLFLGEGNGAPFIILHPTAIAGWVGLLLTALNLLPIGQLDGGHVAYAFLGRKRARILSVVVLIAMCALAAYAHYWGWYVFALVIACCGAMRHPRCADDDRLPLDAPRKVLVLTTLFYLCVGSFARPLVVVEPNPFVWQFLATREEPMLVAPFSHYMIESDAKNETQRASSAQESD